MIIGHLSSEIRGEADLGIAINHAIGTPTSAMTTSSPSCTWFSLEVQKFLLQFQVHLQ
jgi:hypothetical protein